ncbi:MAG: hypothetical protein PHT40_03305 [Patescibacteria group bacterium]|nr:hypothetical protein [Patescibacteria group bacterium]
MSDQSTIAQETTAEVKRKPLGEVKIHTMPEKFLNYLTKGRVLTAGGAVAGGTGLGGLKRNVIIGIAVALVFVLVLGAAAWFFVKSINQKTENNNVIINQPSGQNQNQTVNQPATEQKQETVECSDTNCEACSADQCRILANINKCQLQNINEQDLATGEMKVVEKCLTAVAAPNNEATTTPPIEEENPPLEEVVAAPDIDNDGLTDEEEKIWGTDKSVADTDGDGYPDGLEIANLYSPLKGNSARLSASNLANSFLDKENGFSVLYPREFTTAVNEDKSGVTFTATSTGQFFQVQVLENENNITDIEEWYLQMNPTIQPNEIQQTQIGGKPAVVSGSSFYVLNAGKIYLINYNMGYPVTAYFSTSFSAFVKSFDFFENPLPQVNE